MNIRPTTEALPAEVANPRPAQTASAARVSRRPREAWWFVGPAFVASVAYMDPGNFATNIEGGARFGYKLLWVLLWSNAMAILVQYLAAKLGISTGKTLPENCRAEFSRPVTLGLWFAAEIAAMATDLAEFLGAALGFYLLFGIRMLPAAILTGVVVMLILLFEQAGFQWLERIIMAFVAVIGIAYAYEVFLSRPQWAVIAKDIVVPHVQSSSIYIAVSMLGATVMPHVIYLHSALVLPRREAADREEHHHRRMELFDVLLAMNGAWLINTAMLIMAAAVFFGHGLAVYSIEAAHHTLTPLLGRYAGIAFGVALLASGLSSSSVGTMAGQVILQGFLNVRISIFLRRVVTMIPAILVIAWGLDPLKTLVLSQAVLSFCLPFAMIPLLILTWRPDVMGTHANRSWTNVLAIVTTAVILAMNGWLLYSIFSGQA
ncbi:MAG TPA: Nramp family divalent metal transporter [Candidatus Acidoferrales bacterium]|nr:Nramp family divalent metal transporter [Candidatus Acidoferrales bacterium]